jgi:hypothetical protein
MYISLQASQNNFYRLGMALKASSNNVGNPEANPNPPPDLVNSYGKKN